MKHVWKPLKPRTFSCRQPAILEWMDATSAARLSHVLCDCDRWRSAVQAGIAIVKSARRLELRWNVLPVATIGDKRNCLDEMVRVVAGNMALDRKSVV